MEFEKEFDISIPDEQAENIQTVRDLVSRTEDQLLEMRNFGDTTLTEVREKLTELGLHLGMRVGQLTTNLQPTSK